MRREKRSITKALAAAGLVLLGAGCLAGSGRTRVTGEESLRHGAWYEQQKQPWDAIVVYRKGLEEEPGNVELRLRLADLLTETGDHRGARTQYRLVLERDPENVAAINNLGWVAVLSGYDLDWAAEAVKALADKPSPHRHVYLDTLGMVYLKQKRYRDARVTLGEAMDLCDRGEVMSTTEECREIKEHLVEAGGRE